MQRMHVVTVRFPDADSTLGARIQRAYDEGDMPDGSWRRLQGNVPPEVEIAIVLDGDTPIEIELMHLGAQLAEFVKFPFYVIDVGPEEDHRDLDPCFAPVSPTSQPLQRFEGISHYIDRDIEKLIITALHGYANLAGCQQARDYADALENDTYLLETTTPPDEINAQIDQRMNELIGLTEAPQPAPIPPPEDEPTRMVCFEQIEPGIVAFSERSPFPQANSCYADAYDMIMAKVVDGGRILRDRDANEPHDVFVPDELFAEAAKLFAF